MVRGLIIILIAFGSSVIPQSGLAQTGTVDVIGQVYDEDGQSVLPYAHVLSSKWATTTNVDGKFKAPLERDDTIRISFVGFKDYHITIPEDLEDDEYALNVIMSRDTIYLEEAEIFFLPENEEEFKEAIIALELNDKEYNYALRNISLLKRQLRVANYDKDELDAAENARLYMQGPQPVYFNFVFDKLRAAMRKNRKRKKDVLPELDEINPSAFSTENNRVGISDEDQKAFADSLQMPRDSTFYYILKDPSKVNNASNKKNR